MTDGDSVKYNMLYSVYSYPKIVIPFFSGVFVDKLGLKVTLNVLFALWIVGQAWFSIGGFVTGNAGYVFAIFGRTFLGKFLGLVIEIWCLWKREEFYKSVDF